MYATLKWQPLLINKYVIGENLFSLVCDKKVRNADDKPDLSTHH